MLQNILQFMENVPTLNEANFSSYCYSDVDLIIFTKLLDHYNHHGLKPLNFFLQYQHHKNTINAYKLANAIANSKLLTGLEININRQLTDEINALLVGATHNTNLKSLSLRNFALNYNEQVLINNTCKNSKTLQCLQLNNVNLNDTSLSIILSGLIKIPNSSLKSLKITEHKLTTLGFKEILTLINKTNIKLNYLEIDYVNCELSRRSLIFACAQKNITLKTTIAESYIFAGLNMNIYIKSLPRYLSNLPQSLCNHFNKTTYKIINNNIIITSYVNDNSFCLDLIKYNNFNINSISIHAKNLENLSITQGINVKNNFTIRSTGDIILDEPGDIIANNIDITAKVVHNYKSWHCLFTDLKINNFQQCGILNIYHTLNSKYELFANGVNGIISCDNYFINTSKYINHGIINCYNNYDINSQIYDNNGKIFAFNYKVNSEYGNFNTNSYLEANRLQWHGKILLVLATNSKIKIKQLGSIFFFDDSQDSCQKPYNKKLIGKFNNFGEIFANSLLQIEAADYINNNLISANDLNIFSNNHTLKDKGKTMVKRHSFFRNHNLYIAGEFIGKHTIVETQNPCTARARKLVHRL